MGPRILGNAGGVRWGICGIIHHRPGGKILPGGDDIVGMRRLPHHKKQKRPGHGRLLFIKTFVGVCPGPQTFGKIFSPGDKASRDGRTVYQNATAPQNYIQFHVQNPVCFGLTKNHPVGGLFRTPRPSNPMRGDNRITVGIDGDNASPGPHIPILAPARDIVRRTLRDAFAAPRNNIADFRPHVTPNPQFTQPRRMQQFHRNGHNGLFCFIFVNTVGLVQLFL